MKEYEQQQQKEIDKFIQCSEGNNPNNLVLLRTPQAIINLMFVRKQVVFFWYISKQVLEEQLKIIEKMQKKQKITMHCVYQEKQMCGLLNEKQKQNCKVFIIMSFCSYQNIKKCLRKSFENNIIVYFEEEYLNLDESYFETANLFIVNKDRLQTEIKFKKCQLEVHSTFSNFVSVQNQAGVSNVLNRSMFAMLEQNITLEGRKVIAQKLQTLFLEIVKNQSYFSMFDTNIANFIQELKQGPLSIKRSIYWYTTQTPIYMFVNNLLRLSRHPAQIFYIQPYFLDLFTAIHTLHQTQSLKTQFDNFTCYRGGMMSRHQITQFEVGGIVQNLGFLSASLDKKTAFSYAVNVFFEIWVKRSPQGYYQYGFAWIAKQSEFFDQNQILFNPLNSFKIIQKQQIQHEDNKIFNVRLQFGQLGRICSIPKDKMNENDKWVTSLIISQNKMKKNSINQGAAMVGTSENIQGAELYINKYLSMCRQNSKLYVLGLVIKSQIQQNNENDKYSIQCLQKCFQIAEHHNQIFQNEEFLLRTTMHLAILYLKNNQFDKFKEYYQKNQHLIKKLSIQYDVQRQLIQIQTGHAAFYFNKEMYEEALKIYSHIRLKARRSLTGSILLNQALCYTQLSNFEKALELCQSSKKIIKKFHGVNSVKYLQVLLAMIHIQKCLKCYQAVSSILQQCISIAGQVKLKPKSIQLRIEFQTACILYQTGDATTARKMYLKLIQEFSHSQQDLKTRQILYQCLTNLAIIYKQNAEYESSVKIFKKLQVLLSAKAKSVNLRYISTCRQIATCYYHLQMYRQSLQILEEHEQLLKPTNFKFQYLLIQLLPLIAANYIVLKQYKKAYEYCEKSQALLSQPSDNKYNELWLDLQVQMVSILLMLHQEQKGYELACTLLEKVQVLIKRNNKIYHLYCKKIMLHTVMCNYYQLQGDYLLQFMQIKKICEFASERVKQLNESSLIAQKMKIVRQKFQIFSQETSYRNCTQYCRQQIKNYYLYQTTMQKVRSISSKFKKSVHLKVKKTNRIIYTDFL